MPKILAFAASTRRDSWNRKLIRVAAQGAQDAGADVTLLELIEYPVPIYNADDEKEHGLPGNVAKLAEIFRAHEGFLISSPEYNNGYPGLLKNMLDWLSRPGVGGPPLSLFANKPCAIMAASPGKFGGVRMLPQLRQYLNVLQMLVIPQVYGLALADQAFNEDGTMKDPKADTAVKALGERVAKLVVKLAAS
jgi:chromate reductase